MWEDYDLAEKLEGVGLEKCSGFCGPVWFRFVDISYE